MQTHESEDLVSETGAGVGSGVRVGNAFRVSGSGGISHKDNMMDR